jgi:hypothetical protein
VLVRLQHLRHCWVGFVLRYSLIHIGCPQPKMNLCLSIDFCVGSSLKVTTRDECLLVFIVLRLHNHLGSSLSFRSVSKGLSVFSVTKM